MEFEGRIQKVCEPREGVSARTGNPWKTQGFVFEYYETPNQRYVDRVYLETFDTNTMAALQENAKARVGFEHRVREYEGKLFNELHAYKIEIIGAEGAPAAPATGSNTQTPPPNQGDTQQPPAAPAGGPADDLPF